jgi:hypothetical protein
MPEPTKRLCKLCGRALSQYNKDEICMSHKPEDAAQFRDQRDRESKNSHAILAFIKEFHQEGTPQKMLAAAKRSVTTAHQQRAVTELERYPEALGLLKMASLVFRLPMPDI